DLGEEALDANLPDHAAEVVAGAHLLTGAALQPGDLRRGHEPPVGGIALGADAAGAVPAAERVEADPERTSGLGCRVRLPPRHCLVRLSGKARRVSGSSAPPNGACGRAGSPAPRSAPPPAGPRAERGRG